MRIAIIGAALLVAGCGAREPLTPAAGQSLPRAPALSSRSLTPEELLAVPSEFRPLRVDEPITRSRRREPDRFDLPPPDVPGAVEAEPSGDEEESRPATASPPQ